MRVFFVFLLLSISILAIVSNCDNGEINHDIQAYTGQSILPGLMKHNRDLEDIAP